MKLILFTAKHCKYCPIAHKALKDVSRQNPDLDTEVIDVENNSRLVGAYGVRSVPSLFFLKDGQVMGQLVGSMTVEKINSKIEESE